MKSICLFVVAGLLCAPACTRGPAQPPETALSYDRFVRVLSELATTQPHQRAAVLRKHDTSDGEIRAFVATNSANPRRLAEAFDSAQKLIDSARAAAP